MFYRFHLVCPQCGKQSETTAERKIPPPRLSCGDCLIERVEVVEFKIVRVDVVEPFYKSYLAAVSQIVAYGLAVASMTFLLTIVAFSHPSHTCHQHATHAHCK